MQPERWQPDWADISDEAVARLLEEARENLRGTIEIGINTDQRAATLFAGFLAGAFALFAISASLVVGGHSNIVEQGSSALIGIVFFVASQLCLSAMTPQDFYVGGYEPRRLFSSATDLMWMQRYTIEDMQRRIDANKIEIYREAALVNAAIRLVKFGTSFVVILAFAGIYLTMYRPDFIRLF